MVDLVSFWKLKVCGQTVLPDRSILIGQKLVKNAKMESFKCDVFGDFQTLCLKVVMNVPVKISWRVKSASPFVELGNDFPPLALHSNDFVLKTLPQGRPSNENRHFLIDMSQLNTVLKYHL